MANGPVGLPAAQHLHTAPWPQGLLQVFAQIQAMDRQQLNPLNTQQTETALELGFKGGRIISRRNLGLQNSLGVGMPSQGRAELQLRGAVVTRGFHMVKTSRHSCAQGGFEIALALSLNRIGGKIAPALLKAHTSKTEHRHRQLSAAETASGNHGLGRVRFGRTALGKPKGKRS